MKDLPLNLFKKISKKFHNNVKCNKQFWMQISIYKNIMHNRIKKLINRLNNRLNNKLNNRLNRNNSKRSNNNRKKESFIAPTKH